MYTLLGALINMMMNMIVHKNEETKSNLRVSMHSIAGLTVAGLVSALPRKNCSIVPKESRIRIQQEEFI